MTEWSPEIKFYLPAAFPRVEASPAKLALWAGCGGTGGGGLPEAAGTGAAGAAAGAGAAAAGGKRSGGTPNPMDLIQPKTHLIHFRANLLIKQSQVLFCDQSKPKDITLLNLDCNNQITSQQSSQPKKIETRLWASKK